MPILASDSDSNLSLEDAQVSAPAVGNTGGDEFAAEQDYTQNIKVLSDSAEESVSGGDDIAAPRNGNRKKQLGKGKKKQGRIIESSSSSDEDCAGDEADDEGVSPSSSISKASPKSPSGSDSSAELKKRKRRKKRLIPSPRKVSKGGIVSSSSDEDLSNRKSDGDEILYQPRPSSQGQPKPRRAVPNESSELVITAANLRMDSNDGKSDPVSRFPLNSELFSAGNSSGSEGEEDAGAEGLESRLSSVSPIVERAVKPASPGGSSFSGRRSSTPNKAPKSKKRGLRKDEKLQLQSDVQKRVRERVSAMPKHHPKQMTLAEILSLSKRSRALLDPEKSSPKKQLPSGSPLSKTSNFVEKWLESRSDDKESSSVPSTEQHEIPAPEPDADDYFPSLEELTNKKFPALSTETSAQNPEDSRQKTTVEPSGQLSIASKSLLQKKLDLSSLKEPKIRLSPDVGFIDLEDEEEKRKPSALDLWLDDKIGRHAKNKPTAPPKREKAVGIVTMRKGENGEDVLQRHVRMIPDEVVEIGLLANPTKPGAQRMQMQQILQESIARKRKEGLEERTRHYKEEMGENEEKEEEEESEARDEDFSDSSGDSQEDEDDQVLITKSPRLRPGGKKKEFVEEEAAESGNDEEDLHLELGEEPDTMETEVLTIDDEETRNAGKCKEDASTEHPAGSNVDLFAGTMETEADLQGEMQDQDFRSRNNSTSPAFGEDKLEEEEEEDLRILTFPPEESQGVFVQRADSSGEDSRLKFQLPDTLSQLERSNDTSDMAHGGTENKEQDAPNELLLLCSGTFSQDVGPGVPSTQPVSELSVETPLSSWQAHGNVSLDDENAREGFGLGEKEDGVEEEEDPDELNCRKRTAPNHFSQILSDDEDENAESFEKSQIWDEVDEKRREEVEEGEEKEEDEEEGGADKEENEGSDVWSSEDEVEVVKRLEAAERRNKRLHFRDRRGRLRREFFEREAELSGSDLGSDDEEVGSDDDVMEAEEGDLDDLPTENELRQQIGRFHMKQDMDDDERRLLLLKERYIEEGEDNTARKFRWRRQEGDEDLEAEMMKKPEFHANLDVIEEEETEAWAKQRVERARWLLTFQEKGENGDEEGLSEGEDPDSAILKFGRLATRKLSVPTPEVAPASAPNFTTSTAFRSNSVPDGSLTVFPLMRPQGSLLGRDAEALVSATKATLNPAMVDTRKGVFTRISPNKNQSKRKSPHSSLQENSQKKPKIVNEDSNSLFELL